MITKIKTAGMSRAEWLEERKKSIGGSEIGAILGLNPWASPYSVWANKTGRTPDAEPNEAMRQGTDLEDYVARRFAELSGLKVERCNYILRNDAFPHLHANIDRRVIGLTAGLECKTASALSTSRFAGGDFPASYYAQCVSYMAITGLPQWFLAVVILGKDFRVYQMTADPETPRPEWCESSVYVPPEEFDGIRSAAADFWRYVEEDTPPPVDGTSATSDALAIVYREPSQDAVDLFGCDAYFRAYADARARLEADERMAKLYANAIKERLAGAETGVCGAYTATWKTQTRRTLDARSLQKEHPELDLTPFYRTTTFRKFTVKETE